VGAGERHEPRLEGLASLLDAPGTLEGLHSDGLDCGEGVLDPVIELVDEKPQMVLGLASGRHVQDGADHPSQGTPVIP
jgi:hypothetical protein